MRFAALQSICLIFLVIMMNRRNIEELVRQCVAALPQDLLRARRDVEQQLRNALTATLRRMDLVTREEFDVQAALLSRTRERLEALQTRIDQLEAHEKSGSDTGRADDQ